MKMEIKEVIKILVMIKKYKKVVIIALLSYSSYD